MEIKKRIEKMLDSAGISKEELVLSWVREKKIDLQKLQEQISHQPKIDVKEVSAGMFVYPDKKISSNYDETAIALILSVNDDGTALLLSLNGKLLPFTDNDALLIETYGLSGFNAMQFIVQMSEDKLSELKAIKYCQQYFHSHNDLILQEQAFLLAEKEVGRLNYETLYPAFEKAGLLNRNIWTSTIKSCDNRLKNVVFQINNECIAFQKVNGNSKAYVHPVWKKSLK